MASPGFQNQPGPPDQQENISYVKEAFHLQYNWIAMSGAGAFALISGSFLPIILAGGLELMYPFGPGLQLHPIQFRAIFFYVADFLAADRYPSAGSAERLRAPVAGRA